MFKRILIYAALSLSIFFWVSQHKFSAPFIFDDWQIVELVWAAKKGDTKKIDQLIENGVDINAKGKFSFTPLSWVLLNTKPNHKSKIGFKHLLIKGANTSDPLAFGLNTPLHYSASIYDSYYLEEIIKHGHDLNINDNRFGDTPLMATIAIGHRSFNNFLILLNAGADPEIKKINGNSVLSYASGNGTWRYTYELLNRGADFTEISPYNSYNIPDIVLTLENIRYWPQASLSAYGIDWREKVIEFLRNEGVEVYPWYPEDDPRYNPNPNAALSNTELKKMWDYCFQLNQTKEEGLDLKTFNDVNLYSDISPDNYSLESDTVFGLAMINLKKYQDKNDTKVITAEFYGRDQDKYSHYFFNNGNLQCVLTVQDVYNHFKTQTDSQIESTIINAYITYKDTCYKRNKLSQFQRLKNEACETMQTDAQTYLEFQN